MRLAGNMIYVPVCKCGATHRTAVLEENQEDCSVLHSAVELHLSGLIGTASHSDMQKIRMDFSLKISYIGSSAVTIYRMYLRLNLSTTPDLKF